MTPDEKVARNLIYYVEGTWGAAHRDVAELAREIGEPDSEAVERALRLLEEVRIDDVVVIEVTRSAEEIRILTRPPLSLGTRLDEICAELSDMAARGASEGGAK